MIDKRTNEQIREQYEIEKELAAKLRNAPKEERKYLYTALYEELFRKVPHHPLLVQKASYADRAKAVCRELGLLKGFIRPNSTFLEIGPGDCRLAVEVAKLTKRAYGVDVSEEITSGLDRPENLELAISDGCSVPVPPNSVDVAYSHHLMEHLHPDDALEQLQNIVHTLTAGGIYICVTPNRLSGPHDISRHFDKVATGFHLKEYTTGELTQFFWMAGFSQVWALVRARGFFVFCPPFVIAWLEGCLATLPNTLRKSIASRVPIRQLLGITLIGTRQNRA